MHCLRESVYVLIFHAAKCPRLCVCVYLVQTKWSPMLVCFKFMLTEHLVKTYEMITLAGVELLHYQVATQRASFSGTFRTKMKGALHGNTGLNTICRCISGPLPGCLHGSF